MPRNSKSVRPEAPPNGAVVRSDVKGVPKPIYDRLARTLFDLRTSHGYEVSIRRATIRGMELAAEEIEKANNLDAVKRIYPKE